MYYLIHTYDSELPTDANEWEIVACEDATDAYDVGMDIGREMFYSNDMYFSSVRAEAEQNFEDEHQALNYTDSERDDWIDEEMDYIIEYRLNIECWLLKDGIDYEAMERPQNWLEFKDKYGVEVNG